MATVTPIGCIRRKDCRLLGGLELSRHRISRPRSQTSRERRRHRKFRRAIPQAAFLFGADDNSEVAGIVTHQPAPCPQDIATFDGQHVPPPEKCSAGGLDCGVHVVQGAGRDIEQMISACRIDNAQRLLTRHPLPVQKGTMLDQLRSVKVLSAALAIASIGKFPFHLPEA